MYTTKNYSSSHHHPHIILNSMPLGRRNIAPPPYIPQNVERERERETPTYINISGIVLMEMVVRIIIYLFSIK